MVFKITKVGKGNVVGKSELSKKETQTLFDFCRTFDMSKHDGREHEYLFDVRGGVIHWLEKETKSILSSFYCDIVRGHVKIELGDTGMWDHDVAITKWEEMVNVALHGMV